MANKDFISGKSNHNVSPGMKEKLGNCRRYICRNGRYPLIVAPFVTLAWLTDIYCTTGCNFVHIDIGFKPVNEAWNKAELDLGLFYHHDSGSKSDINFYMDGLHENCHNFDSAFNDYFVKGDKTWQMSQIMSLIAGSAGSIALATIWMVALTPISPCFLWPVVLLPSVLVSFLTSAAKFLFFDTEICRSELWVPEGENGVLPLTARKCSLSTEGIINIGSTVLYLITVFLICLRSPKRIKRDEIPDLYNKNANVILEGLRTDDTDNSLDTSDLESQQGPNVRIKTAKKRLLSPDGDTIKTQSSSNSAYDLEDIRSCASSVTMSITSKQSKKMSKQELERERLRVMENSMDVSMERSMDYEFDRPSVTTVGKQNDYDTTERFREVESSNIYDDEDFSSIMNRSNRESTYNDSSIEMAVVPHMKDSSASLDHMINNALIENSDSEESPFRALSNNTPRLVRRPNCSPASAPSDEINNYYFRSPTMISPSHDKENATPNVTPMSGKRGSTSRLKAMSTVPRNNQSKRYDDDLINRCVTDLTDSFQNVNT